MKKTFLTLGILAAAAVGANAQIVTEAFNYNPTGSNLAAYTGTGTGWSGNWTQKGGATNINAKNKTWGTWTNYTALPYTNGGAAGPNVTTATGQEAYRAFSSGINTGAAGTYYFSFLLNADPTAGEGFSNFVFANAQSDSFSGFGAGNNTVGVAVDNNGLLYVRSNGATGVGTGISLTKGNDYLVIGKMDLTAGADTFSISAFATGATVTEPVTWGNSITVTNGFT